MEPRKFPEPLLPPLEVEKARADRYRELLSSSFKGIAVRALIAFSELTAAFIYGSASLFMDGLSTGFDILTSLVLIVSFKLAAKPPDTNHPFGHGRFEPLAGFQLGLFLAVFGGISFFYHAREITHEAHDNLPSFLWMIPLIAILLLEGCYRILIRTAKKQRSPALAADAVHYRVDSVTSIFALIALLLASYFPQMAETLDHAGAVFIALFMVIAGGNAARQNFHQILDRTPPKEYFMRAREAAKRAHGVMGTEKIRMQLYGPDAYIGIDIEVDPELSVFKAHEISQKVRFEIQRELPEARDVIVHIEPYYPNDH